MKDKNKSWGFYLYQYSKVFALCLGMIYEFQEIWKGEIPYISSIIKDFVYGCASLFGEVEKDSISYSIYISLFLMIILLLLLGIAERFWVMRILVTFSLLGFLLSSSIMKLSWSPIIILIALFYMMDTLIYFRVFGRKTRERDTQVNIQKKISLSLFPFVLAAAFLAIVVPSREEPINWSRFVEAGESIKDSFKSIVSYISLPQTDEFSLTLVGFTGNDIQTFPGGALGKSDDILLTVRCNTTSSGDGYLTGCVRNIYSSKGWSKEKVLVDTGINEYKMNFYELMYNLYQRQIASSEEENICKNISYTITYDQLQTLSVFHPTYSYYLNIQDESLLDTTQGKFEFKSKEGKKIYRISTIIVNTKVNELQEYLRTLDDFSYENSDLIIYDEIYENTAYWESVAYTKQEDIFETITSKEFRDDLIQRAISIEEHYLDLPDTVPQRVYNLADEITKDATTRYDKILAIEAYLEQFPYTRTVDRVPEDQDFVDYFLFEQQKGYCIHFASAMSVLSRCIGIPTRYVEGVTCPFKEKEGSEYIVRSYKAHAWTEVYLEGYGWLRVEATPGYGGSIKINYKKSSLGSSVSGQMMDNSREDSYGIGTGDLDIVNEKKDIEIWIIFVGVCIFTVIFSFFIVFIGIGHRQKKIYKSADYEKRVRLCMKKILSYLNFCGFAIQEGETLKAYGERIPIETLSIGDEIKDLLPWFEKIRYSTYKLVDSDLCYIEEIEEKVKEMCKRRKGRIRFLGFSILNQMK